MGAYARDISGTAFGQSCERFEVMISWLAGQQAQGLTHAELETRLQAEGRELLRVLAQDHLDLRARQEPRLEQVVGADGVGRAHVEADRSRSLATVFGPVTVRRLTGRSRSSPSAPQPILINSMPSAPGI